MIVMSSKAIKDHYGAFADAARRGPVVHTSHGRPTLVTISIDKALEIPELRDAISGTGPSDRQDRMSRLLALGGAGAQLIGPISSEALTARSRHFRGND